MTASSVDDFVAGLPAWQGEVVRELVELIADAAPEATAGIKWSQPVFEDHGPFCYIKPYGRRINFGFWRGAALADPTALLHGAGGKMRHVKITEADRPDPDALRSLIVQAVERNRAYGDPRRG